MTSANQLDISKSMMFEFKYFMDSVTGKHSALRIDIKKGSARIKVDGKDVVQVHLTGGEVYAICQPAH